MIQDAKPFIRPVIGILVGVLVHFNLIPHEVRDQIISYLVDGLGYFISAGFALWSVYDIIHKFKLKHGVVPTPPTVTPAIIVDPPPYTVPLPDDSANKPVVDFSANERG